MVSLLRLGKPIEHSSEQGLDSGGRALRLFNGPKAVIGAVDPFGDEIAAFDPQLGHEHVVGGWRHGGVERSLGEKDAGLRSGQLRGHARVQE